MPLALVAALVFLKGRAFMSAVNQERGSTTLAPDRLVVVTGAGGLTSMGYG